MSEIRNFLIAYNLPYLFYYYDLITKSKNQFYE
jgi:hypothetical protein